MTRPSGVDPRDLRAGSLPRSAPPPASAPAALEDPYVLGALSGAAALALAWSFPLWGALASVGCPLRELTGIPCPTCYGTRAMLALVGGNWVAAVRYNPLVAAGGIGLLGYVPWALGTALGGWPRPRLSGSQTHRLVVAGGMVVVANWVYLVVAHA